MSRLYLLFIHSSTLLIWQISEIKACPPTTQNPKPQPTTTTLKPIPETCNVHANAINDYQTNESSRYVSKKLRKGRAVTVPVAIYVEILVVVDDFLLEKIGGTKFDAILYIRNFISAVDMKFQGSFTAPRIKMHIAGVLADESFPFIENKNGFNIFKTKEKMIDHFGNKTLIKSYPFDFDIVLLLTGEEDLTTDDDDWSGFSGYTQKWTVCNLGEGHPVIAHDRGQFSGVMLVTHLIGHMLGSPYDGEEKHFKKCCPLKWNIMSHLPFDEYTFYETMRSEGRRNAFIWSNCSIDQIQNFVSSALCLFNTPMNNPYPLLSWEDLTMSAPSLQKQCSVYMQRTEDCISYQRNTVIEAEDSAQRVDFPDGAEVTKTKPWRMNFCQKICKQENCMTTEINYEIGCIVWRTLAIGFLAWSEKLSSNECRESCRKNPKCLQWQFHEFKIIENGRFDCREFSEYNSVRESTSPSAATGSKYRCKRPYKPDCGMQNFDCYSGAGSEYLGYVSKTKSGIECQRWNMQYPHKHGHNLGRHNYCRNPDGWTSTWCYTLKNSLRWEECNVKKCKKCDAGHPGNGETCGRDPCQFLECSTASEGCKWQRQHAMEGSQCDKNKFCFQGNCVNGNNWVSGQCAPRSGNGVIKLGFFKYNEGMEDCLASCRIYGLTACEFDKDDGECWAFTKDVAIGTESPVTFCYKFKDTPSLSHGLVVTESQDTIFATAIGRADCAFSKFGFTLNPSGRASRVLNVSSASECADHCADEACNFWSFDGFPRSSCLHYRDVGKPIEDQPSDNLHAAWGTRSTCNNDVCLPYQQQHKIATDFEQEFSYSKSGMRGTEKVEYCSEMCQILKKNCVAFYPGEEKCVIIETTVGGINIEDVKSPDDCLDSCRKHNKCLQWQFREYIYPHLGKSSRFDCRLFDTIYKVEKLLRFDKSAVGSRYSCKMETIKIKGTKHTFVVNENSEVVPLKDGESILFTVDRSKYNKCDYPTDQFLLTKNKTHKSGTYFEAEDTRFGFSVGKAGCNVGLFNIDKVEPVAQECGLMETLATLCFIDQDLNGEIGNMVPPLNQQNLASRSLASIYPEKLESIENKTESMWVITDDGHAILGVALSLGITKVLLDLSLSSFHVTSVKIPQVDDDIDIFDECRQKRFAQHRGEECLVKQNETDSYDRCDDAKNIANGEEGKKQLIDSLTIFKREGRILYPKYGAADIQDILDNIDKNTGRVTIKSWKDGSRLEMEIDSSYKYVMTQTDGDNPDRDKTSSGPSNAESMPGPSRPWKGEKEKGKTTPPTPMNMLAKADMKIDRITYKNCEYEQDIFSIEKKIWVNSVEFRVDNSCLGFIKCSNGHIKHVHVNENVRRCGLGTRLTTLCLIDNDLNGNDGHIGRHNMAIQELRNEFQKFIHKRVYVEQHCQRLWYLIFNPEVDNPRGYGKAYVFFNAAIDAGFTKMFLVERPTELGVVHPRKGFALTSQWKNDFTPENGFINSYYTINNLWFFCKPKPYNRFDMQKPTPMETGEIRSFFIADTKRPKCKYEDDTFTIKKEVDGVRYTFTAEESVGRIWCKIGEVSLLNVVDEAVRCGLGTLLTKLCFIDGDMNGPNGNVERGLGAANNEAFGNLEIYGEDEREEWVKENCEIFWSLMFTATPATMGHNYMNAADYAGLTLMFATDNDKIHPENGHAVQTNFYNEHFHPDIKKDTAIIYITKDEQWENKGSHWFFCKPKN